MLNPALYAYLVRRFKSVKVLNAGQTRIQQYDDRRKEWIVAAAGEHYNVNCPLCGDTKFRCSISYNWLRRLPNSTKVNTTLIHCYNEECEGLRSPAFYDPVLRALDTGEFIGFEAALANKVVADAPPPPPLRLPNGCVPLQSLPPTHQAHNFLASKYNGLTAQLLGEKYGALYTDTADDLYRLARFRIIFPVYEDGKLVNWQGRTINHAEPKRWYFPPGSRKSIYRRDDVPKGGRVVVCEGITTSIATAENAVAIFGKALDLTRAKQIAERWPEVLIGLDPETFFPEVDKKTKKIKGDGIPPVLKLKSELDAVLPRPSKLIKWPAALLELGRRKALHEKVEKVPDAADIGRDGMSAIIAKSW